MVRVIWGNKIRTQVLRKFWLNNCNDSQREHDLTYNGAANSDTISAGVNHTGVTQVSSFR